jgi:putative nucleotidyltransferase with HDIG domain
MAAYWIQHCRERKVFIMAGLKLGLLNIVLAIASEVYSGNLSGMALLWSMAFAFAGGIGTGIMTLGLAPLMEFAFGYATDITLLELANLDRPLLRKLMIEAPGTYHHSMVVGNMVEAAAAEIGANPLLAKVCGYYHDIGKIKKPLYFIENQTDGVNRHDKLAPSMSSLILIAHVKNGVEIARENKLGQGIIDTIQQHHGKSLITFFYEKARQQKGDDAVKIEDFRYPGPLPQTREAGLVMLADVVEAASRTLENPTASRIQRLAQDLFNKIFSDGQLDNCELTLKDLHKIAGSYYKILTGIHHHRIEYSESPPRQNGKDGHGSTDRQSPGNASGNAGQDRAGGSGHLRRLGMS